MNTNLFAAMLGVLLLAGGCLAQRDNMLSSGTVQLNLKESRNIRITNVSVKRYMNETVITGNVQRERLSPSGVFRGHVDIEIFVEGDRVFTIIQVPFYPRSIPWKGSRKSRFSTRISIRLLNNSVIHMRYHNGEHNEVSRSLLLPD